MPSKWTHPFLVAEPEPLRRRVCIELDRVLSSTLTVKVMAMNDAGNYVEPVPVNNPLQQAVDRQGEQIKQLKETNKEMKEQLKQKDSEVGCVRFVNTRFVDSISIVYSQCANSLGGVLGGRPPVLAFSLRVWD